MSLKNDTTMKRCLKLARGTPEWYDGEYSYFLMLKYGDDSKELEEYLKNGTKKEISD